MKLYTENGKEIDLDLELIENVLIEAVDNNMITRSNFFISMRKANFIPYFKRIYNTDSVNINDKFIYSRSKIDNILSSKCEDLQLDWINLLKEYKDQVDGWIKEDKYSKFIDEYKKKSKFYQDSINLASKLKLSKCGDDAGGTEFGIDINTKKIYMWDVELGAFFFKPVSIDQYLSLRSGADKE